MRPTSTPSSPRRAHRGGGIHHVTAIAGDPQENIDFYAGLLGMRLVKRSVNQDDPGTYHLFYADAEGHPGGDLTFFPWPDMGPGRHGTGLANEVVFALPPGALDWWQERLERHGTRAERVADRFGEPTLAFHDPHGLHLAMTETPRAHERPFASWTRGPVPEERQIRGIHAVRLVELTAEATKGFATRVLGMRHVGTDGEWDRYAGRDPWSGHMDVAVRPELPCGEWGTGTVHRVAWRVRDDDEETALQETVRSAGVQTTPVIDRFWFHSVYFREPGGVLFELATDGSGFSVDEDVATLGEKLVLPPWLEPQREAIEAGLPPLRMPDPLRERSVERASAPR